MPAALGADRFVVRLTVPFVAKAIGVPQLPTTLPTLDELIGCDGITVDNVHEHLLKQAELEAAADNNLFIYRNFAGGTPETDDGHGA